MKDDLSPTMAEALRRCVAAGGGNMTAPVPQEAAIRALKTMRRKRWDEAEQQSVALSEAAAMSADWHAALDRLVTLRAELREIGRALSWAEDGASWAVDGMSEALRAEHGALVTAQGETT